MTQRTQYKDMTQGKSSIIDDPKIRFLEDIGFMWSRYANNVAWIEKYEGLKQFKCDKWRCNVPKVFSEK